tara:strand:+ start:3281 stop:3598 length:318 start_codon:yes stop_codon:yes gene_type:complete
MLTEFGFQIERARKQKGLSQQEIAESLGMKQANYSKLVNGNRTMTAEIIDKLSAILDLNKEKLIADSGHNQSPAVLTRSIKELSQDSQKKISDYIELLKLQERNQ